MLIHVMSVTFGDDDADDAVRRDDDIMVAKLSMVAAMMIF